MAPTRWTGAVVDVAASHHGVLTRRLAAELGITPNVVTGLLRRGIVEEPAPGLLVVCGSAPTFDRLATAASLLVGGRGALHATAAGWIHRVDGIDVAPERVGLLVGATTRVEVGTLPIDVAAPAPVCRPATSSGSARSG